jgi:hypothetical protein
MVQFRNFAHFVGSQNADIAREIYRRARKLAAGNEELFKKFVVEGLKRARLPIPKKYLSAATIKAAAKRVGKAAAVAAGATVAGSSIPIVAGVVVLAGAAATGVFLWRRRARKATAV